MSFSSFPNSFSSPYNSWWQTFGLRNNGPPEPMDCGTENLNGFNPYWTSNQSTFHQISPPYEVSPNQFQPIPYPYQPNQFPSFHYPPNQFPSIQSPPNQFSPNPFAPNQFPPNLLPLNQFPPNPFPPNQFLPIFQSNPLPSNLPAECRPLPQLWPCPNSTVPIQTNGPVRYPNGLISYPGSQLLSFQPQVQPVTQLQPRGQASPEAIDHLRNIGLVYNPLAINGVAQAQAIPHPALLFPPAPPQLPDSLKEDKNQPGKYVLVDVDALAKVLRKTVSADTLRNGSSTRLNRTRTREYLNNLVDWDAQRWKSRWNSDEYEAIQAKRSRSWDRELRHRDLSSLNACPSKRTFWESDLFNTCYRNPVGQPSLFGESTPRHPNGSFSLTDVTRPRHVSGPPRNNAGTGSPLDLFGSFHERHLAAYQLPQRHPQVVANLPYRFPSRTTLSLYPTSFDTLTRKDGDICRVVRNVGPRNLSVNLNPFADPLTSTRTEEVKRTPSGNFNAGVTLSKPNYFCQPNLRQLNCLTTSNGKCFVTNFIIGHLIWGEIKYEETFDVSGLNLDQIVDFQQGSVVLYPARSCCLMPSVGQGLNRPATVILRRVFPTNPIIRREITDAGKVRHSNFIDTLRQKVASYDGTFLSYNPEGGIWTFKVPYIVPNTIRPYTSKF